MVSSTSHRFIFLFYITGQLDDPLEKREKFAVSLREQKRKKILAKKRNDLYFKTNKKLDKENYLLA